MNKSVNNIHSAAPAALGFYYQSLYALMLLLKLPDDDGAVGVETLDDVTLKSDGQDFLSQLKHSVSENPPPISIKSDAFWKTIKAWIDILDYISLPDTHFCLVSVGELNSESPLQPLTDPNSDRSSVARAMMAEAQRVVDDRQTAKVRGEKLPYSARYKGCEAFLGLLEPTQNALISRITLNHSEDEISVLETRIEEILKTSIPPKHRSKATEKLVAWWDREVLFSLCGKRDQYITKLELQQSVSDIISNLVSERFIPDFEDVLPPDTHSPDNNLNKQIDLVHGTATDKRLATREEWRARSQRSKWVDDRLDMASRIGRYDSVLVENWEDKHARMREDCEILDQDEKASKGLELLRWSHNDAPHTIRPFSPDWNAPYLIRGSFQILAIDLKVGWHPDYAELLDEDE